jgi:hypothetical protein
MPDPNDPLLDSDPETEGLPSDSGAVLRDAVEADEDSDLDEGEGRDQHQ